jgi:hypothetical protein
VIVAEVEVIADAEVLLVEAADVETLVAIEVGSAAEEAEVTTVAASEGPEAEIISEGAEAEVISEGVEEEEEATSEEAIVVAGVVEAEVVVEV